MQKKNLDFKVGEVVATFNDTYLDTRQNWLYSILVRTINETNPQQIYCRPADLNIKKIPLVGELVFIFQAYGNESSSSKVRTNWYYLTTLPVQSALNHNSLAGASAVQRNEKDGVLEQQTGDIKIDIDTTTPKTTSDADTNSTIPLGVTFNERADVPFLQPYEGDLLIEGRFGNSIRFGSSHGQIENGRYNQIQASSWDGRSGSPIIILSNRKPDTPKKFTLENINEDYSSLYLTSPNQEVKTIQLSKELTRSNGFSGSQLIGSADKIVLQAKTGTIVFDASKRISMNADEILLGSEGATSPLVKGDVLEQVLKAIISAIRAGVIGPAGAYSTPVPGEGALAIAEGLLNSMKSTKFKIDKE